MTPKLNRDFFFFLGAAARSYDKKQVLMRVSLLLYNLLYVSVRFRVLISYVVHEVFLVRDLVIFLFKNCYSISHGLLYMTL